MDACSILQEFHNRTTRVEIEMPRRMHEFKMESGSMQMVSKGEESYVLTFVDDFSRFVVAHFLNSKSVVAVKLAEYKTFFEKRWGKQIKCIRFDNRTNIREQEDHIYVLSLDELEVNGIYDTTCSENKSVTHVFTELNEEATHFPAERRPVIDEPMNSVEESTEDIETGEVELERKNNLEHSKIG
ncbi:FOG: Transposon-encoded proteins with TYA, reverse transcriptase, integrase domains in various combinations [Plasmopara halstedii]|uniref:FOG: Transposon-encoded proteins with TYA, reverse transcriptase, integrase domains in various combinations n=1 Tax=Plasmopara halstedii TaxID=4781 RepID=A0A0P1AKE2_PLAHL|nr:FOG: Transposon-encoded proteins with TYA, reverse transcriptase, integrase domains in various combinations [Plasmopara halstedii]CEG41311.1 FOG: Transposon-encoded proteins with TYA, reverse transcriptase, integrase domains in various combinations [Plasmopara halstedii]|eukprot:XP_024577680.1 FOG: Transposon-encoded proteins with TYA, reverse transcriptase, integrase domains in various combinations [Plasmopara halstedii]